MMSKDENPPVLSGEALILAKVQADRAQQEKIRGAEVQLLSGDLVYQEFRQRREDFPKLFVETGKLEELSPRDYNLARQVETRPHESQLRPGELTLWRYLQSRKHNR